MNIVNKILSCYSYLATQGTHATPLLPAPLGGKTLTIMHWTTIHAVRHAVGSWPGIMTQ